MKWKLFVCSDCDTDDGVLVMRVPDDAHAERGCPVDFCPGCESRYSLLDMGPIEVEGTSLIHILPAFRAEPEE
jgi:hypothetical protein